MLDFKSVFIFQERMSLAWIVINQEFGYDREEGVLPTMKRKQNALCIFILLFTLSFLLASCAGADGSETQVKYISNETGVEAPLIIPDEYKDKVNPLANDPAAIASGNEAYFALCSQCHGEDGRGHGTEAASLNPPPADFTNQERMRELTDGYLFWRISDGGNFDPYNSLMTAWGTLLSEQEMWELISYLRTLPEP